MATDQMLIFQECSGGNTGSFSKQSGPQTLFRTITCILAFKINSLDFKCLSPIDFNRVLMFTQTFGVFASSDANRTGGCSAHPYFWYFLFLGTCLVGVECGVSGGLRSDGGKLNSRYQSGRSKGGIWRASQNNGNWSGVLRVCLTPSRVNDRENGNFHLYGRLCSFRDSIRRCRAMWLPRVIGDRS